MATQSNSKSSKGKTATPVAPAAKPAAPAVKPAAPAAKPAAPAAKAAPAKARAPYEPTAEEIQTRAFEIYVSEGCRAGSDLENWLRAEKELRSQGPR
jgi:hypothetical protein